jgi:hypothetical protein
MVILNKNSNLNPISLPYSHSWDQNIRKYYDSYQKYIDAQTYHLQRTQRYFLVNISITIRVYLFLNITQQILYD